MTKKRIDGYLSRIAQNMLDPTSIVVSQTMGDSEEWILQRKNQEDLGLGNNFHLAEQGIRALIRSERAKSEK